MAENDDDDFPRFPGDNLAMGVSNIMQLTCVVVFLAVAWIVLTGFAIYFSWTTVDGTFSQGLATNTLAGLLLLLIVPVLLTAVQKSIWYSLTAAIIAAGVLFAAAWSKGALRDILLNVGTGLWFMLLVDFYVVHRFKVWTAKMEEKARKASEKDLHLLL